MLEQRDLFGGAFRLPPELRLLSRFSLRLSPSQKRRFFAYAARNKVTPSEVLRKYVLSIVGES